MTVQEVLDTPEFNEEAEKMIQAYKHREQPEYGSRYKRTPFDTLEESGEFTVEALKEEFTRIDTGVSDKPSNTRREVGRFVIAAAKAAYNKIERRRKEASK